ncbi:hypothetical protein JCGZ_03979 [Jatropha curcas]|uniref:Uncharacterized protein n=1 Tax=Jatropha curcas TaxID=180498 RepID=A0A067KQX8_JATCU|nr:uncharacterized protein LOC105633460 [Jatropha curcas]KDP38626.1 hypothetical protein JCGZ_03979 [Jatropha curcas]
MATSILGSPDYIRGRIRHQNLTVAPPFKKSDPSFSDSHRRRYRNFNHRSRSKSRSMVAKLPARNLAIGDVKILRRGESLTKSDNRNPRVEVGRDGDLVLGSTERLRTCPETINKVVDGMFVGSAFVVSPPPSSLPVPAFLGKNSNGAATDDLRRLLRLDLV